MASKKKGNGKTPPARHKTMEVEAGWLEEVPAKVAEAKAKSIAPPRKASRGDANGLKRKETMEVEADWLEDEQPRRSRGPWDPPTLPPPPNAVTVRRIPVLRPGRDEESKKASPSKRPPKVDPRAE